MGRRSIADRDCGLISAAAETRRGTPRRIPPLEHGTTARRTSRFRMGCASRIGDVRRFPGLGGRLGWRPPGKTSAAPTRRRARRRPAPFTVLMLIAWQTNCGSLHRGFPHQLAPLRRGFSLTVAANRSSATATQCQTKAKISGRGRAVREAAKLKGPELSDGWRQHGAVHYAAHARANARTCSPGEDPFTDLTSSRVCLPSSSSTNESSQCVSVPLVRTILTMFCSCTSFRSNRGWRRASCSSVHDARRV
jgi:hypothetical protein